ncbi:MAG: sigma 54-interacting transcriptional regulator, partial [Myxococcota bacterium]
MTEPIEKRIVTIGRIVVRVVSGPDLGACFESAERHLSIGTDSDCDVRLTDRRVSSRHAAIEVGDDGIRIADLGSTNGTHYLGTRAEHITLGAGGVITVGATELRIRGFSAAPHTHATTYGGLVGDSAPMQSLFASLEKLEPLDSSVLLLGETGTGKSSVAREIHRHSKRTHQPFIVFDCAATTESVIESELFGHVRGAFTGALADREGAFSLAADGTLFLDEVAELSLDAQRKLLGALEEGRFRPVGSDQELEARPRIISATHRPLERSIERGEFRSDLYYRLNVISLSVPPLRERLQDLPALARALVDEMGLAKESLPEELLDVLQSYSWPGNIRELRNLLTRALFLGLPAAGSSSVNTAESADPPDLDEPLLDAKKRV